MNGRANRASTSAWVQSWRGSARSRAGRKVASSAMVPPGRGAAVTSRRRASKRASGGGAARPLVLVEAEAAVLGVQSQRFVRQLARRGGGLFGHGGVLLGDLVHLA